MAFDPKPIAAFIEYVVRPMSEDWRLIVEKLKELNVPLSPDLIRYVTFWSCITHVFLESLRLLCYVGITWLVCQTVVRVL